MNQSTPTLMTDVRVYLELKERLKEAFDLEDGEETLLDTLEGESTLPDRLAGLVRAAVRDEAMADAMKAIIADNQARKKRFEDRAQRFRTLVLWAMGETGLTKLAKPDLTASVSSGRPAVTITGDPGDIPDVFCRIRREPDKTAIREYLEHGDSLSFATLGNPSSVLTIRSK